jgi:acetyl esterase
MKELRIVFVIALALNPIGRAELHRVADTFQPVNKESAEVYKTTPQGDLKINLYFPKDWKADNHRPAIVFFFGGGFTSGDAGQFVRKSEYFASRGIVAASADYRIKNTHHTGPEKSIEDAKSAVRWLRMNARQLGIDTSRIVASGGSSGGACAAYTAFNSTYEPEGEDMSISSNPDALVLFFASIGYPKGSSEYTPEQLDIMKKWGPFYSDWQVTKGGPPTISFVGTKDPWSVLPLRFFTEQMIAVGNRAELYTAEGEGHGFSSERPGSPWAALVVRQIDVFLASLGYLKGPPLMAIPPDTKVALRKDLP